jgi:NADH-quinone oxidoreductase subunit M
MVVAFFAALGLPGLSGFISEAFSFLGAFQAFRSIAIASTLGIVLTAAYMLWTLQRVFLGTLPDKWKGLTDISTRELVTLVPLAVIVIILGIYPSLAINMTTSSINTLVDVILKGGAVAMIGH